MQLAPNIDATLLLKLYFTLLKWLHDFVSIFKDTSIFSYGEYNLSPPESDLHLEVEVAVAYHLEVEVEVAVAYPSPPQCDSTV